MQNSQNNLLFVGVMTAKNFLKGRANAVFDTWGKRVPGRIAFFSSEDSFAEGLPVVALKNVDDRYPPQKKSFMMLYYMYKHFIDKFEWFARTDDDVYINTHKLEKFLRSIDSSKPQFIGIFIENIDFLLGYYYKSNEFYILKDKQVKVIAKNLVYCHWNLMKTFAWVALVLY